jgi:hypothetical protein
MSRSLTAGVQTAIADDQVRPFLLYEGEFVSGTIRAWNGIGDLSWGAYTWSGVGSLINISSIEEASDVKAAGITILLNGISQTNISLALSDCRQGKSGKVWIGFMNESNEIITDPYLVFDGRLDTASIDEGAESASISLSYESRLIDLQKPREIRYTHEEQQRIFADDMGLEFVVSLQEMEITWGRATESAPVVTEIPMPRITRLRY